VVIVVIKNPSILITYRLKVQYKEREEDRGREERREERGCRRRVR
jgi:hypothetical protein